MKLKIKDITGFIALSPAILLLLAGRPALPLAPQSQTGPDTTANDTGNLDLPFPFTDNNGNMYSTSGDGGLYLNDPSNYEETVEYDPESGEFFLIRKIGDIQLGKPEPMDFDDYIKFTEAREKQDYWNAKEEGEEFNQSKGFRPQIKIKSEAFDRIFGGNTVDIRPNGSAELIFGVNVSRTDNPAIPEKQRRISTFDFDEKIQLNVIGNIGDKMKLTTNYNTEATFDFENQMKLEYTGYDDDIIKKIEAGNVTLPLTGSLITGSQSLFGIKTKLQFGRLMVTSVFSQQKGQKSSIEVEGGAQINDFEVKADNYEDNRHFFLGHYFRDQYEKAVATPPLINSGVNIIKVEVWVTNTTTAFDNTRNVIAFQDLGEGDPSHFYNPSYISDNDASSTIADNDANDLYSRMSANTAVRTFTSATVALNAEGLEARRDYQRVELARKLSPSEFYFNPLLGYISMNQELNPNQAIGVAYQYTYRGKTYQVGEFSTDGVDGSNALYLKLLRSTELNTRQPMWDLMMKNVYALGAYQVKKDRFLLDVYYLDAETGVDINYLPGGANKGKQIILVQGLDKLDINNNAGADGVFDFIDNPRITISPKNGRIYFPLLEPFSTKWLGAAYGFDSLYTTTQASAEVNFPERNRFTIKGEYQSSTSSEISLNAMNIPDGAVTVTAGGQQLVENQDYTVDYTLGRVKIINQGILESGTPIKVDLESNALFNIQSKSLFATRFDYKVSDDLVLGGTVMNLTERPLTQKVNIGDEPMSNTVVGIDGTYHFESQLLSSVVDAIPMIDIKEPAKITLTGEAAKIFPGHSGAIGKTGTSYIDDFEGSQSAIDIRSFSSWVLASTPQGQKDLFPEGGLVNNLASNFNRAKLAWYVVDPLFWRNNNLTPDHIKDNIDIQENAYMSEIYENDVFPQKSVPVGQPNNIPMFDLSFYPYLKGPYNYDVDGLDSTGQSYAAGIDDQGNLNAPETRWGGVMRRIETNDFEDANVEFIEFWMMDPFIQDDYQAAFPNADYTQTGGELYFNLGNCSEDILTDGMKSFENGLPTNETESSDLSTANQSVWGRVPTTQSVVPAFDNDPATRPFQDVGLDGLRDKEERGFFAPFINKVKALYGASSMAYKKAYKDPSSDDYNYFRDDDYDAEQKNILERYMLYNGLEGNSPTAEQSDTINADKYPTSASTLPNAEDINRDNTLDEIESYFQYKVKIDPQSINENNVGNNYITDVVTRPASGNRHEVKFYQFKIPIRNPEKVVGGISDFRSIRFIRMFVRGFKQPVVLRFARLDLIRGEWRKYLSDLDAPGEYIAQEDNTSFDIAAVNIEENAQKTPVNYVLPPDIQRELNFATTNLQQLNEQALVLSVCGLSDGSAKAAYRNVDFDVRSYKRLKMFVHAESSDPDNPINDDDLRIFIRLGTDFDDNYYEYEIPLKVTLPGYYDPDSDAGRRSVWREENNMDLEFSQLKKAKSERNALILEGGQGITIHTRFERDYYDADGNPTGNKIAIVGNPNLSEVRTVMIGIRNPKADPSIIGDDGLPKCAEIWVNEMRLTDFDEAGGWAAIGRAQVKLGDFANLSLSGSISTPGWGSIEKKVSERQKEQIEQVDASTSVELGKFLPDKTGIRIPMYVGFSQGTIRPQYDPQNPDSYMDEIVQAYSDANKDSVLNRSNAVTIRRSLNFTNVRKEKGKGSKSHFYDISNWSGTYSYNYLFRRDFDFSANHTKTYRGGLAYNFNNQPKNIQPFRKWKPVSRSKWLRIVKDANFYIMPKQLSFRTDINRIYSMRQNRNNSPGITATLPPFYNKTFDWLRTYNVKWDLTKALKLDFQANNKALIEEPDGVVNKNWYPDEYQQWKDTVMQSISTMGANTNYHHNASVNYNLPLNKIPLTNWINATARYQSSYDWTRAPFAADSLGATIQNSNTVQVNGTFNMITLYNKLPYFKKVNRKFAKKRRQSSRNNKDEKDKKNKIKTNKSEKDTTKAGKSKKKKDAIMWYDHIAKVLMSVRNFSVTYSQNNGILMPGYGRSTRIMGLDPSFTAPGAGFIFGQQHHFGQDELGFPEYAAGNDWLVHQENLNTSYSNTYSDNLNARATIEPLRDMRIELTANQTNSKSNSAFFRWDEASDSYVYDSPVETGSYSSTIITWRTAFVRNDNDNNSSVFTKFLENRAVISQRLAEQNSASSGSHATESGYEDGYGGSSSEVLIPAFLAAYTGMPSSLVSTNPFAGLPKPNWRITYNGLSKIKLVRKFAKTVTLNHAYRSSFNIGSYTTNLTYEDLNGDGFPDARDINTNFIPQKQIQVVTISEQFSPLMNVDITWSDKSALKSLTTRLEVKKDRNLSLSMANTQVTEIRNMEYVIGLGYNIPKDKLKLPKLTFGGKKITLDSDLKLRCDFSIRNGKTIIRKVVEEVNQVTAGNTSYNIKITGDYVINNRLNLRLFYDRVVNKPAISTSFPTANTNAGLSIRFTLSS